MVNLIDLAVGTKVKHADSKYNGKPIVFEVAAKNHAGYPANSVTLITEKIISIKAFDARESSNADANRRSYGNNRYLHSNMRQWMNKDGTPWYLAQHGADQAPDAANLNGGWNPYNTEAGFLSGFDKKFKDALLATALTTVKNNATDGGGIETVTDKVFLPSTTEVGLANEGNIAEGAKWPLFSTNASRLANPTAEAVSASNYTNSSLKENSPWYWWLRTPYAGYSYLVRNVSTSGALNYYSAFYGYYGVRPALNLGSGISVSDTPDVDGVYLLTFNEAPTITGSDSALGDKVAPFIISYQVDDKEKEVVTVTEYLNNQVIRTIPNAEKNKDLEFELTIAQWATISLNVESTMKIEAIDTSGNKTTRIYSFVKSNAAPTTEAVEPLGDLVDIAIVDTLNPIFVHKFIDIDSSDQQTAMQYKLKDLNDQEVYDSAKKATTQSFHQILGTVLEWGQKYKWQARTWDRYDVPSEWSFPQFFIPNRAPNVTNLQPGSSDVDAPAGAGVSPSFTWDFSDLDLEDQAAYRLKIFKVQDDGLVFDTNWIYHNVQQHDVRDGALTQGTAYYAILEVRDPNGLVGTTEKSYFVTNATPTAPIQSGPINNYRTPLKPTFSAIVGTDAEDDGQHFMVQLSKDPNFIAGVLAYRSDTDRTGWKVAGYDIPEAGVLNDQSGQTVTFKVPVALERNEPYFWRIAGVDASTNAVGKFSDSRKIRAGNTLTFETKTKIDTGSTNSRRILTAMDYLISGDGTIPATLQVESCNNAYDVEPTWEDITDRFLSMDYYDFVNDTKESENFAIAIRVDVKANDTMGLIHSDSLGFTFD